MVRLTPAQTRADSWADGRAYCGTGAPQVVGASSSGLVQTTRWPRLTTTAEIQGSSANPLGFHRCLARTNLGPTQRSKYATGSPPPSPRACASSAHSRTRTTLPFRSRHSWLLDGRVADNPLSTLAGSFAYLGGSSFQLIPKRTTATSEWRLHTTSAFVCAWSARAGDCTTRRASKAVAAVQVRYFTVIHPTSSTFLFF